MNQGQDDRSMWLVLLAIGGFSLWYVATKRSQNPLWLIMAGLCLFTLAYHFYGRFVARHVLKVSEDPDDDRGAETSGAPWVLGYHFAAIAGVGALIAPVAVVQYGFLPGLLWVLVGVSLAGAVHDFVALLAAVRYGGRSLPQTAKDASGPVASSALILLVLLTLVVVLSAVATTLVELLAGDARATYTLALTIPMALFVALYPRLLRPGHSGEAVVVGLVLFILAVLAGTRAGSTGFMRLFLMDERSLIALLALYSLIAALIPMRALSLVHGALSGYLILGAMGLMAVLVAFAAPPLQVAPTTAFIGGGGPLLADRAFPTVSIVLAAAAVSGFHALVASGPTARLVQREGQALPVGFGAMLLVGFLALVVLAVIATLSPADYIAINTSLSPEQVAQTVGTPPLVVNQLRDQLGRTVAARPGGPVTLVVGVLQVLKTLPKARPAWFPHVYQAVNMLTALLLFAGLEAGVLTGWLLIRSWLFGLTSPVGVCQALVRIPALRLKVGEWLSLTVDWSQVFGFAQGSVMPAQEGRVGRANLAALMIALLLTVTWALLSLVVSPRFTDPLVGVSSLLLAAGVLGLGTVLVVRLHSGHGRPLALVTLIPALALLLVGLAGGALSAKGLWSQASAPKAFSAAYQELPVLATRHGLIPLERAWAIVREMPASQASEAFAARGQDGLAQALSARFGDSVPQEGARLADLVVRRAWAVSLWGRAQVVGILLAMISALMLVGASVARSLAVIRAPKSAEGEQVSGLTRDLRLVTRDLRKGMGQRLTALKSSLRATALYGHLWKWLSRPEEVDATQRALRAPLLEESRGEEGREAAKVRESWASLSVRVLLFVASLALGLLASWILYRDRGDFDIALLIYAASLVCLRLAFYAGGLQVWPVRQVLTTLGYQLWAHRWELLGLSLAFAVGVFFRVYRFGYFPPANGVGFEEAQAGGDAFKVLRYGRRTVEFPLTNYLPALSFALWGTSTTALRLPFLILGCLTLLPFYLLLRELVDRSAALFGTFLLAVSRWHAVASRVADELFLPIFFEVLILYLIVKGNKTKSVKSFFWLGILSAYMLYAYTGYRVIPLLILLFYLGQFFKTIISQIRYRGWSGDRLRAVYRIAWQPALIFAVTFLIVASPLFVVTRQGDRFFMEPFSRASASQDGAGELPGLAPQQLDRLKRAMLVFTHKGESYPALNLPGEPMLDLVSRVLFALGIGYSVLTFFRPYRLWLLLWIVVVMLVSTVPPNLYVGRFSNLIPLVFIFISFLVGDLGRLVDRRWGLNGRRLYGVSLVLLSATALVLNYRTLFGQQISDSQVRRAYQDRVLGLCNYAASLRPDTYIYVWDRDQVLNYVFLPSDYAWACHDIRGEAVDSIESVLPARVQAGQIGYLFVNPIQSVDELSQLIRRFYPQVLAPSAIIEGEQESYRIVAYLIPSP